MAYQQKCLRLESKIIGLVKVPGEVYISSSAEVYSTTLRLMSVLVSGNKELFKSNTAGIYCRDAEKEKEKAVDPYFG